MFEHGGQVRRAARQYGIAEADWLDLSTGINPNGYPVPELPPGIWERLPQDDDDLHTAAEAYYGTPQLLAVAGSQAAIQALPMLRPPGRVLVVAPSYAEHAQAWQRHRHQVIGVSAADILKNGTTADVAIVVNPNNPDGKLFNVDELLHLHAQFASRGGWLIIDEAFVDATPEHSLAPSCPLPGLIVLRSLGKFFGLAGARVGFALAEESILGPLAKLLGPWAVTAPSRYVATLALRDTAWQHAARQALPVAARRLAELMSAHRLAPSGGTCQFQWVRVEYAKAIHRNLAQQGILTRLVDDPDSIRFGLPRDETQWLRLSAALGRVSAMTPKTIEGASQENGTRRESGPKRFADTMDNHVVQRPITVKKISCAS